MAVLLPPTSPIVSYTIPLIDSSLPAGLVVVTRAPRVSTDPTSTHHIPTSGQLYPRGDN